MKTFFGKSWWRFLAAWSVTGLLLWMGEKKVEQPSLGISQQVESWAKKTWQPLSEQFLPWVAQIRDRWLEVVEGEDLCSSVINDRYQTLPIPKNAPSAHAATAAFSPQGLLTAVWFASSREGARDVQLYQAFAEGGVWQAPRAIASADSVSRETGHWLRKIGNPALILHQEKLYLFFVGVTAGGWAGSRLYVKTSKDGHQWSPARLIVNNAFFNVSTLVRSPPLSWGEFILVPAYHELISKNPEWFIFNPATLRVVDRYRPPARGYLQPTTMIDDEGNVESWFRASGDLRWIGWQKWYRDESKGTLMAGKISPTPWENPNASVAARRLSKDCILLAHNPAEGRQTLIVQTHCNQASHPTLFKRRINAPQAGHRATEFSYPTLVQRGDDLHLFYTENRERIAHRQYSVRKLLPHPACQQEKP